MLYSLQITNYLANPLILTAAYSSLTILTKSLKEKDSWKNI